MIEKEKIGYPSIDKPWLKYYTEDAKNIIIPAETMYQFIRRSNQERLDNTAILYLGTAITYRELFANIEKFAQYLWDKGIREGDIVSIMSLNTPETVYAIYALNYIGAVANLIGASVTMQEVEELLTKTDSKLLLALDKIYEKIQDNKIKIPIVLLRLSSSACGFTKVARRMSEKKYKNCEIYDSRLISFDGHDVNQASNPHSPALILYTSGTTGQPKGVVLTSYNINSSAIQCSVSGKNYQPNESFLNILPPFFGFGMGMLHLCLYTGMREISTLVPKVEPIIKMLKKYKPERFVIGPAFIDAVNQFDGKELSFLIDLTGGGGAISLEKENQLNSILEQKKSGSKYLAGYGMTELAPTVSMNQNQVHKEQSVGIPLPLTNVKVIDLESGTELSYMQEGELLVASPGLMAGYYNNPTATDEIIEIMDGERWIHTGDLAKIDEDGFIYITGRIKRIYITMDKDNLAYKIFPQRMEEIVEQSPLVEKCGVVVIPDEVRLNVPVIYVTMDKGCSVNEATAKESIYKLIEEKLPAYYQPIDVVILKNMPINSSQKIDYRTLEQMCTK